MKKDKEKSPILFLDFESSSRLILWDNCYKQYQHWTTPNTTWTFS